MQSISETRRPRILVVDDDPLVRDLVSVRLDIAGYDPVSARDGFEAMKRVAEAKPAAMILDINMPGRDGFEVLSRMGKSAVAKLPTMVLTARNQPDDVRRALALGARDFLSKPFKDDQLLRRVARLLRAAPASSIAQTVDI